MMSRTTSFESCSSTYNFENLLQTILNQPVELTADAFVNTFVKTVGKSEVSHLADDESIHRLDASRFSRSQGEVLAALQAVSLRLPREDLLGT